MLMDTLEAALEPLVLKTKFSGEVVAVLAPSHGHVPLYRAQLPGQLVRGSRTELPSLPRAERSLWPHCEDVVRMSEVPLHVPGTKPFGRASSRGGSRSRSSSPPVKRTHVLIEEEDEFEVPDFDPEAALAAARRDRNQRSESIERGRPLGIPGTREAESNLQSQLSLQTQQTEVSLSEEVVVPGQEQRPHSKDAPSERPAPGAGAVQDAPSAAPKAAAGRRVSVPSRESSLERDRAAQAACSRSLAQAEALMMASIRPRPKPPKLQLVGPPPVVEVAAHAAAERRVPDRRALGDAVPRPDSRDARRAGGPPRQSLSPARPKKSPRDLRAREKIGKLLVAHYEVRSKSLQTNKWTRMLMRVILASEEKNPDALKEGLALLQNAQNLIGAGDEGESKSRVALRALCLVDRKVKVRSPIADAVRTLEELTKRKEKLLVDMTPMGSEEASVGLHLEDTDVTLADELKKSWHEVHREATNWPNVEKIKESATAKQEHRLKKKTEAEKEVAVEQMKKSMGTAVLRFAQAEAKKVEDETDLGEEALQRAARIDYAIKAAKGNSVDHKHPDLLRAAQITYDLRALRAMRYCQHLMSTIEPGVVGSAGNVANLMDQMIQDASELYQVPKDHPHMEEARKLVVKARTEEAQVKRSRR